MEKLKLSVIILALAWVSACDDPLPTQLQYQVIGGKTNAPIEMLEVNCDSMQLRFQHAEQQLTAPLDAEQCDYIQRHFSSLCRNEEARQSGADFATYDMHCQLGPEQTSLHWIGTLSAAPAQLSQWHKYSRGLIQRHWPGARSYP